VFGQRKKELGAPAGGKVEPSKSPGNIVGNEEPRIGMEMIVAGRPASILVRSIAKACGPRRAVPVELKTFMLM